MAQYGLVASALVLLLTGSVFGSAHPDLISDQDADNEVTSFLAALTQRLSSGKSSLQEAFDQSGGNFIDEEEDLETTISPRGSTPFEGHFDISRESLFERAGPVQPSSSSSSSFVRPDPSARLSTLKKCANPYAVLDLRGLGGEFLHLERARALFLEMPHEDTLAYATSLCLNFLDNITTFLESTPPLSHEGIKPHLRHAAYIHNTLKDKGLTFASVSQTVSHLYLQGLDPRHVEKKTYALTFASERPNSLILLQHKTASVWVYGALAGPAQNGAKPLRDDSLAWQNLEKLHTWQGRLSDFFFDLERTLMSVAFESPLKEKDPCLTTWEKPSNMTSFMKTFVQTWDNIFIHYLTHVLWHENEQMQPFLTAMDIPFPPPELEPSSDSSSEENTTSVNSDAEPSEESAWLTTLGSDQDQETLPQPTYQVVAQEDPHSSDSDEGADENERSTTPPDCFSFSCLPGLCSPPHNTDPEADLSECRTD